MSRQTSSLFTTPHLPLFSIRTFCSCFYYQLNPINVYQAFILFSRATFSCTEPLSNFILAVTRFKTSPPAALEAPASLFQMATPSQTIDGQFVDPGKLIRLLQETYGEGENNFKVEVRSLPLNQRTLSDTCLLVAVESVQNLCPTGQGIDQGFCACRYAMNVTEYM
jgi:hypothetical protein